MASTFIIGRSGNQPFKITAESVSNEHTSVTIDNNGVWTLEDLDSPNGTYIRNASGEFNQVYKKIISEDTVIRLGRGGHHGCIFTGHQLISTPGDYSYEFRNLKKALARQQADEAMMQAKSERNGWISKCSGMAAIAICALLGSIDGINIDPNTRYILIASAPIIVGLLFRNDKAAMAQLRQKRQKLIVCPKCGRPLSEFDVENMICPSCKAR